MKNRLVQNNTGYNKGDVGLKFSLVALGLAAIFAVFWIVFVEDDVAVVQAPIVEATEDSRTIDDSQVIQPVLPSFDIVRISRNGTGVIAGRAEPNSDVYVYAFDKEIGMAIADRRGEWVLLFDEALPSGPTEISLKARTQNSFEILSSDIVIVSVPERDENRFVEDETEGVIAILSTKAGRGPSRVLQKPSKLNLGDLTKGLSLDALDYDDQDNVSLSGRGLSGVMIRIYLNNEYLAEVTADDDQHWVYRFKQSQLQENNMIRLDQMLEGDEVEVRVEQPFNRNSDIDLSKSKGSVIVRPGNSLWQIARKLYGNGFQYTLIFSANKDMIKDPDLIYPGQRFALPSAQITENK